MEFLRIFLFFLVVFSYSDCFKINRYVDPTSTAIKVYPRKITDFLKPQGIFLMKTIAPTLLISSLSISCKAESESEEAAKFVDSLQASRALTSDEFEISFSSESLNIR